MGFDETPVTMWVTKYALTRGILKLRGVRAGKSGEYFTVTRRLFHLFERVGKEAFLTEEEALVRAEEKRQAKLKSFRSQIKKLESLKIDVIQFDEIE